MDEKVPILFPKKLYDDITSVAARYGRSAEEEVLMRICFVVMERLGFSPAESNVYMRSVL